jgi:Leucine-rich repeat (LRR) protein
MAKESFDWAVISSATAAFFFTIVFLILARPDLNIKNYYNLNQNSASSDAQATGIVRRYAQEGITELAFDKNDNLTEIPEEIGNIKSLLVFSVSGLPINSLPASIGNLVSLQTLTIRETNLSSLPPETRFLVNLKTLNLEHNNINSIPPVIYDLPTLTYVNLSGNPIPVSEIEALKVNLPTLQIIYE